MVEVVVRPAEPALCAHAAEESDKVPRACSSREHADRTPPRQKSRSRRANLRRGGSIAGSAAVDSDREGGADLAHALVAQATESIDQDTEGHALDRVEVDRAQPRDGIPAGFEQDFARQATDGRGARGDDCPSETGDGHVTAQHHDRTTADLGQLAPPQLAPTGVVAHDAAAAALTTALSGAAKIPSASP